MSFPALILLAAMLCPIAGHFAEKYGSARSHSHWLAIGVSAGLALLVVWFAATIVVDRLVFMDELFTRDLEESERR